MLLLANDNGLSKQLIKRGYRERGSVNEMKRILGPGMHCLDLGANLGFYALLEAKTVGDTGHVYAVEPVEKNFDTLNKNIALNRYKNISTYNFAVGNYTGKAEMKISRRSNNGSLCPYSVPRELIGRISVSLITLKDFCCLAKVKKLDLIRMDVEGYETEVIKGLKAIQEFVSKKAYLSIEVHVGGTLKKKYGDRKLARAKYRAMCRAEKEKVPRSKQIFEMLDRLTGFGFNPYCYIASDRPVKVENNEELKDKLNVGGTQVFFRREI